MQPQAALDGHCDDRYFYRAFRPSFGERVRVTALKLERVPSSPATLGKPTSCGVFAVAKARAFRSIGNGQGKGVKKGFEFCPEGPPTPDTAAV